MTTSLKIKQQEVIQKKERLDLISAKLKSEFVGIDKVIDEILESVSAWYIFPEIQNKPLIINMWGLTGVGKTSLVKRFVELLEYDNKYYRFDMGEVSDSKWAIRSQFEDIYEYRNGTPMVICLDEFQHAKTKDASAQDKNNPATRIVWDLLDNGKFYVTRYIRGIDTLTEYIKTMRLCVKGGVKVENGIVTKNRELFKELFKLNSRSPLKMLSKDQDKEIYYFVGTGMRDEIYDWSSSRYSHKTELNEILMTLNEKESIRFMEDLYDWSFAPVQVDCSKSLIFVMGNLDEVYQMSGDYNPDMNADDFHEQSLKINVTDIKNVLRKYFRNEQIARLGNLHIIYPAFNNDSYRKIIEMELKNVSQLMFLHQNILIEFDQSVLELIFKEGVYPAQGTRPLFTTIHQLIKSKLSKILCNRMLNCPQAKSVKLFYRAEELSIVYYKNSKQLFRFKERPVLNLENLRREKRDDLQAIVAVHESGHALITIFLLKVLPQTIFSSTVKRDVGGFVSLKSNNRYLSRKSLVNEIAMTLGGYVAEKIVFGEDYITLGSGSDIDSASELALMAIKNCGLGVMPIRYSVPDIMTNYCFVTDNSSVEDAAKNIIETAMIQAERVLLEQKTLLLKLADHLSDNRTITQEKLLELISAYAAFPIDVENYFHKERDEPYYRAELKRQINKMKHLEGTHSLEEV